MTETAVAETSPVFPDEIAEMTFNGLSTLINKRNALVGTANAANGDRVTLKDQITEQSTDAEIVAARNARDEAVLLLDKLVNPKVEAVMSNAVDSIAGIEEEIKDLDGKLKPGVTYLRKMYGESVAKFLPAQAKVKGVRLGGGGTGGRRIRGFVVEVTVDEDVTLFDNFASAAKHLGKDTTDLQAMFFKAAGDPKAIKDAPDEVNFTLTFTETFEDGTVEESTAEILAYRPTEADAAPSDEVIPPAEDDDEDDFEFEDDDDVKTPEHTVASVV